MSALVTIFLFTITYAVLLSLFMEFCFRERNIFGWWLPVVARTWLGSKENEYTHEWIQGDQELSLDDFLIDKVHWVTAPLGACVVCFGFWVTAIILLPYMFLLNQILTLMGLNAAIMLFLVDPIVYSFGILFSSFLIRLLHGRLL